MKNNGIQNNLRFIEITINENEAKQIKRDLYLLELNLKDRELTRETKLLLQMLEKFDKEV